MTPFKFELGQTVQDAVTKFQGIILARTQHLTSCNCYGVSPSNVTKDGKKPDWEWFDEPRLSVVKGSKTLSLVSPGVAKTGGPHSHDELAPHN